MRWSSSFLLSSGLKTNEGVVWPRGGTTRPVLVNLSGSHLGGLAEATQQQESRERWEALSETECATRAGIFQLIEHEFLGNIFGHSMGDFFVYYPINSPFWRCRLVALRETGQKTGTTLPYSWHEAAGHCASCLFFGIAFFVMPKGWLHP